MTEATKSKDFVCRFAVGENGMAHSGVWRVWSYGNDLYCGVRVLAGELKASIHSPKPPEFPDWKRHWGFAYDAKTEVASKAKQDGGRHKVTWPGCPLGSECSLEWRIVFRGSSLRNKPIPMDASVAPLPIPSKEEYVEVAVILGPQAQTTGFPKEKDRPTSLLAEGSLADGRRVWVVYCTGPVKKLSMKKGQTFTGKAHVASSFGSTAEMRGSAVGNQDDGSLAFWDLRVELKEKDKRVIEVIIGLGIVAALAVGWYWVTQ